MLLDWFTIFAQVFNFLILVLLLRRFLYRPIIKMMEERQARLARQIEDAERMQEEAAEMIESYQQQRQELQEKRQDMLNQAHAEVEAERHHLLHKARLEVDETRSRWLQAVEQEKESFLLELRQHVALQTAQAARRALTDLADVELEAHVVRVFTSRLKTLDEGQKQTMYQALQSADHNAKLRSAFRLPEEMRQEIGEAIQTALGKPASLNFIEDSDLLCGIELQAGGYKLSWSLAEYLEAFEKKMLRSLEENTQSGAQERLSAGVDKDEMMESQRERGDGV